MAATLLLSLYVFARRTKSDAAIQKKERLVLMARFVALLLART
jgi:hypothetical protein